MIQKEIKIQLSLGTIDFSQISARNVAAIKDFPMFHKLINLYLVFLREPDNHCKHTYKLSKAFQQHEF